MKSPLHADTTVLRILAACDPWLFRGTKESHPLILAFYVPADLAPELKRRLSLSRHHLPPPPEEPLVVRQVGHLKVLK